MGDTALRIRHQALKAGPTELVVSNTGKGEHGLIVARLKPGVSEQELIESFNGPDERSWAGKGVFAGSVASVPPGTTWSTVTPLKPGTYALLDEGFDAKGTPGFARGLKGTFVVGKGSEGRVARERPVARVSMRDYRIVIPPAIDGRGVLRITDDGRDMHELALVKPHSAVGMIRRFTVGT